MQRTMRRIAIAMICLAWLVPCAARARAESLVFPVGLQPTLVTASGEFLTQPGEYGAIYPIRRGGAQSALYAVSRGDYSKDGVQTENAAAAQYALMDGEGRLLTEFSYDGFLYDDSGNDTVIFCQGELYGAMDASGREILPATYTYLVGNGEGGYLGFRTDPYDDVADGIYYVDASGQETATGVKVLYTMYGMYDGLIPAASADNGLYGYLNPQGRWAILPQYRWAGSFLNGVAEADMESGAGLINTEGNWLVTPKYSTISYVRSECESPIVASDDKWLYIINPKTHQVATSYAAKNDAGVYFSVYATTQGFAVIVTDQRVFLVDAAGREHLSIEDPAPMDAWLDASGQVTVSLGEWGEACQWLYSAEGELLAGPYQFLSRIGVADGETYYIISQFEVTRVSYDEYGVGFNDETPGTRRSGIIDSHGTVVVAPVYEALYPLDDQTDAPRLYAEADGYAMLLDARGEVLLRVELPTQGGSAD